MKKNKPDYFRNIENISKCCLWECENISAVLNNKKITSSNTFNSLNELNTLIDILRKEYFTTIDREDIFSIASLLHNLNCSLKTLHSDLNIAYISSAEMTILFNYLHSAVIETDKCLKQIIKNNKNDIYSSAFEVIRCTEKGLTTVKDFSMKNHREIITSIQRCLNCCRDLSDRIIYTYLKNS